MYKTVTVIVNAVHRQQNQNEQCTNNFHRCWKIAVLHVAGL